MIVRGQLEQLRESYERVKGALYIDESYLKKVDVAVEKQRRSLTDDSEKLQKKIQHFAEQKEGFEKKIQAVAVQLGLSTGEVLAFKDWSKTPRTVKEWRAVCSLSYLALEESVSEIEKEYGEAIIDLERSKLKKAEVQLAIIRSWNVISKRRLGFNHALEQQVKSYEAPKAEIQSNLARLTEKRARAMGRIQPLSAKQEHIEKFKQLLDEDKLGLKESQSRLYRVCIDRIPNANKKIQKQLSSNALLIEAYSQAIGVLGDSVKRIDNVVGELGSKSFWRRSDQSITWYELKNFFPDIKRFFDDIGSGIQRAWQTMSWQHTKNWYGQFGSVSLIFLLLLRILILILLFGALWFYLPELQSYLAKNSGYFARSNIQLIGATVLNFINKHFIGLYSWTALYTLLTFGFIDNVYVALLFYLASIPYMLWIVHSFITYFTEENEKLGHVFISESYTARFMLIVPLLVYITIGIFFFRQAFMIGNYHASAVPAILNAINFIIFQLSLMALISKEWILSWIPQKTFIWEWVYERVNRYYYILWIGLMAIIVMSNPYVGYGRQVWFVLSRALVIAILIPALSYLYGKVRQTSVDLFFYSAEGDRVKERFASARAWYGFFIIIAFFSFILIGILIAVNVWGYSIGFRDVYSWLNYEMYQGGITTKGKILWVTPLKLGQFILAFVIGLFVAYAFNRIFLKRIFDPLLITSGVQNTIFTLSRYFIVFIALLIGMRSIGLQSVANTLALVVGALSFAFKDQLVDFFAYFIILVQRPIKIGDLIKLENGIIGVVRHITPRSVVMRQKNSYTVIVPNSYIITKAVTNWMYTTTFSGMPEMHLTFPYKFDPGEIKAIIFKVLDSNPNILKSPSPIIRLQAFRDIGFDMMIRAFVSGDKVLDQWDIASSLRIELLKVLNKNGISIAEQTRIVRYIQEEPGQGGMTPPVSPEPENKNELPEN